MKDIKKGLDNLYSTGKSCDFLVCLARDILFFVEGLFLMLRYAGWSSFGKHSVFSNPGMFIVHPFSDKTEGELFAWGPNDFHQCGQKLKSIQTQPQKVDIPGQVLAFGLGEDHTLAVTNMGVFAWGDNGENQCGCNTTSRIVNPNDTPLHFPVPVVAVTGSSYHSMALTGTFLVAVVCSLARVRRSLHLGPRWGPHKWSFQNPKESGRVGGCS